MKPIPLRNIKRSTRRRFALTLMPAAALLAALAIANSGRAQTTVTVSATDSIAAERRTARGELDLNTTFQSNRLAHIRKVMPGYPRPHLWLDTAYVTFNTHDRGPLQELRVRRALSEAIDREFMAGKLLRAGQLPAYGFVPPGTANAQAGPAVPWARRSFAA